MISHEQEKDGIVTMINRRCVWSSVTQHSFLVFHMSEKTAYKIYFKNRYVCGLSFSTELCVLLWDIKSRLCFKYVVSSFLYILKCSCDYMIIRFTSTYALGVLPLKLWLNDWILLMERCTWYCLVWSSL